MGTLFGFGWGVLFLSVFLAGGLLFWVGAKWSDAGMDNWAGGNALDIKDVLMVFFLMGIFCQSIGYAIPGIIGIFEGLYAAQRILDNIVENQSMKAACENLTPQIEGKIEYKDVSFAYPSQPDHPILNQISFSIEPGQRVAFVGETGCGKSTIFGLLERFYEQYHGSILLDGAELKDINVGWLRNYISLVSQEPALFNTTIFENIRLGDLDASHEDVIRVAMRAQIHEFIMSLPQGYRTVIGSRGCNLSGGQKQRLSIARAMIRNPSILLLDEATSSLDKTNESLIMQSLWELSENRTTLIIAQRLSTIVQADCIHMLNSGVIVETGTYQELLELDGQFAGLVQRQLESITN